MFFKKINHWILLIAALLVGTACEKDVILDLADNDGQYVIVEANITDSGQVQWIQLSYSSSYYEVGRGEGITGASVKIESEGDTFDFMQWDADSLPGYYYNEEISDLLSEQTYELIIETEDGIYRAISQLKPVPSIDSLSIRLNPFSELGFTEDTIYDFIAHFRDLPAEEDHYLFNYSVNDTLRTHRPADKSLVSDENLQEEVSLAIFNMNRNELTPGDEITLEIRSISKENFDFYNIFFFQTDLSGNPFAGAPPANIPTNLSEGARGFFQVSATSKKSIIFHDENLK